MKYTLPFTKKQAVELGGGTPAALAQLLQYKSRQAIHSWPDVLSYRDSLMVMGAVLLRQLDENEAAPSASLPHAPTKRRAWALRGGNRK